MSELTVWLRTAAMGNKNDQRYKAADEIERLSADLEVKTHQHKRDLAEYNRVAARIKVLDDVLIDLQKFVDAQAEDAGLWCIASYASEAYIQNGLRGCHRYIEQAIAAAEEEETEWRKK